MLWFDNRKDLLRLRFDSREGENGTRIAEVRGIDSTYSQFILKAEFMDSAR